MVDGSIGYNQVLGPNNHCTIHLMDAHYIVCPYYSAADIKPVVTSPDLSTTAHLLLSYADVPKPVGTLSTSG